MKNRTAPVVSLLPMDKATSLRDPLPAHQKSTGRYTCLLAFLSLNPESSPNTGWEGSMHNRFPTPGHTVIHTSAVLPTTLAFALWPHGFQTESLPCHEDYYSWSNPDIALLPQHYALGLMRHVPWYSDWPLLLQQRGSESGRWETDKRQNEKGRQRSYTAKGHRQLSYKSFTCSKTTTVQGYQRSKWFNLPTNMVHLKGGFVLQKLILTPDICNNW